MTVPEPLLPCPISTTDGELVMSRYVGEVVAAVVPVVEAALEDDDDEELEELLEEALVTVIVKLIPREEKKFPVGEPVMLPAQAVPLAPVDIGVTLNVTRQVLLNAGELRLMDVPPVEPVLLHPRVEVVATL